LAKLRYGGLAWVLSDNMRIVLLRAAYHVSDADPLSSAGLWIAAHPWIARGMAGLALTIELCFPLALVSRKARVVLVPAAFCMLVGIRVLMGPTFGAFLIASVFWLPWNAVGVRVAEWRDRSSDLSMLRRRDGAAAEDPELRARSNEIIVDHLDA
jgi:hypothetical protein